jgi:hypothetical protein
MHEWDITIEAAATGPLDEAAADDLLAALEPYGGAVGYRDIRVSMSFTVEANDAEQALATALQIARQLPLQFSIRLLQTALVQDAIPAPIAAAS